jgi:hypothetical protein
MFLAFGQVVLGTGFRMTFYEDDMSAFPTKIFYILCCVWAEERRSSCEECGRSAQASEAHVPCWKQVTPWSTIVGTCVHVFENHIFPPPLLLPLSCNTQSFTLCIHFLPLFLPFLNLFNLLKFSFPFVPFLSLLFPCSLLPRWTRGQYWQVVHKQHNFPKQGSAKSGLKCKWLVLRVIM